MDINNRATATISPGADLSKIKSYYVVHQPKDNHGIHNLISDRLKKEGFKANAGPESSRPTSDVDSIVTYVDRWAWDITLYLLELTVTLRDASNAFPIAVGNSFHTSLTRKSPEGQSPSRRVSFAFARLSNPWGEFGRGGSGTARQRTSGLDRHGCPAAGYGWTRGDASNQGATGYGANTGDRRDFLRHGRRP